MKRIATLAVLLAAGAALAQSAPQSKDGLTTFRPGAPLADTPPGCAFVNLTLPSDFAVFAAGGYTGRKIDFQIDQSGHQATQMDVAVNYKEKPVVLMLGAYEPTIWNIGWTKGTRIVAVLVSGNHRQAIAGLDPKVPTLNSNGENGAACGYFYDVQNNTQLNPLARRLFGKPVDLAYPAGRGGSVTMGERVLNASELVTHAAVPPESFHDKSAPLAGPAGLEDAMRKGLLRPATADDVQAWTDAIHAKSGPGGDVPPLAGGQPVRQRMGTPHNAYVVLKDFQMPAGLYGGNSATFYVPKGVPRPRGNPGHSTINDFNSLACSGPSCR